MWDKLFPLQIDRAVGPLLANGLLVKVWPVTSGLGWILFTSHRDCSRVMFQMTESLWAWVPEWLWSVGPPTCNGHGAWGENQRLFCWACAVLCTQNDQWTPQDVGFLLMFSSQWSKSNFWEDMQIKVSTHFILQTFWSDDSDTWRITPYSRTLGFLWWRSG